MRKQNNFEEKLCAVEKTINYIFTYQLFWIYFNEIVFTGFVCTFWKILISITGYNTHSFNTYNTQYAKNSIYKKALKT